MSWTRSVEQRDIEIFLTLAEELHFGRTADRLHVTTARVSQTIQQLERRIGARLFDRTSRRVALTMIGRRLRDDLGPAYQQIQDGIVRAAAAARGVTGGLTVGFVGAAAGQFVLEVADTFRRRHRRCEIKIRENQYGDGLDLLRRDEIQMLLTALPAACGVQPDLSAGAVLHRDAQLLAVPAQHPLAQRASVTADDLADARLLRPPPGIPDYAGLPGRAEPLERGPIFVTIQEMLAQIAAGLGSYPVAAHATQYYLRPDVAYVPINDAPPLDWRFVWLTAAETERIRAFNSVATELAAAQAFGPVGGGASSPAQPVDNAASLSRN